MCPFSECLLLLYTTPEVPQYIDWPSKSVIGSCSMLCILHSTVGVDIVWPSSPHVNLVDLVALFSSPSTFLVPSTSNSFISRFQPTACPLHTWLRLSSSVPSQACSALRFHCSFMYKQHLKFHDIQIDGQNMSLRHTIWSSTPHISWVYLVTLFLKPARPLSILGHFLQYVSRIGKRTECTILSSSLPSSLPLYFFLEMQL